MHLNEKTIIATEASSGIGEAAAKLFAREGANVVLGARRLELLQQHVADIEAAGGTATALAGDVEDERYHASLVQHAVDEFGRLDGAFNNAGITGDLGPVPDIANENWREVLDVNLTSAFYAAKNQVPTLLATGGGSIVCTSSFVGRAIGLPGIGGVRSGEGGTYWDDPSPRG